MLFLSFYCEQELVKFIQAPAAPRKDEVVWIGPSETEAPFQVIAVEWRFSDPVPGGEDYLEAAIILKRLPPKP